MADLLTERRDYSLERLQAFRERVAAIGSITDAPSLCIYATGSFGRLEASKFSDLDLFFVLKGSSETSPLPRTTKIRIDAALIEIADDLGFPEFSGDGEYLEYHYLDDILRDLGSRADDYMNFFTARLLLLLESVPIFGEAAYEQALRDIVDSYYRDFHDHETTFFPLFLVNDILRFWKTLCLNYEHKRNRPATDEERKLKNHLQNLKLKCSRLMTCFSTITALAAAPRVTTPDELLALVHKPPLDRLREAASAHDVDKELVERILGTYRWFLDVTGRPRDETLRWISAPTERDSAFGRARLLGDDVYEVLKTVSARPARERQEREGAPVVDILRYMVI